MKQFNWTTVGADHTATEAARRKILAAVARLEWLEPPCTLGMMPAGAIEEAIKVCKIPKVSHVAVSSDLAPCGLYGIRGHYSNGTAEVFILDEGSEATPLLSIFEPKASEVPA